MLVGGYVLYRRGSSPRVEIIGGGGGQLGVVTTTKCQLPSCPIQLIHMIQLVLQDTHLVLVSLTPATLFPESCTQGRLPRVQLVLPRVQLAPGEDLGSRSVRSVPMVLSNMVSHLKY
jgi:hypothetical protein